MKTKEISQRMEVNTTPPPLVGTVSVRTSPNMTPGGDHVASFDAKNVENLDENVELFAAIGTKIKSQKWVKKHESQVCDRDRLKLKVIVLHDGVRRCI